MEAEINIKERISEKAREVEEAMHKIMPHKKPESVYGLAWDFFNRGGKRVRPYLLLTSIEAFNGDYKRGIVIAAATEIFHSFTLLHDDIEDGSEMRRGKPCVHITHGIPLAINCGDGMFAHVFKAIEKSGLSANEKEEIVRMFSEAFINVVEGQGYELEWIHNNDWSVNEEDYFMMAGKKTGMLIAACTGIGAYIGGANEREIEEMKKFGYEIGLAFQIHDDVLNLVGEEEKYKKEIGGDIREGKRTLIVINALKTLGPVEKNELIGILSKNENTREEIERAIHLLDECGAIEYAKNYAFQLVESAKKRLSVVKNDEKRKELLLLADMFVKRES
ncbi:MAG: polyprenyl synthetase family protein [Candidatus Micrarchaeia archaeon]